MYVGSRATSGAMSGSSISTASGWPESGSYTGGGLRQTSSRTRVEWYSATMPTAITAIAAMRAARELPAREIRATV